MENINIPPFYVDQEIVANCNHHQGYFKKGDEFIVTSICNGCCNQCITIGIKSYGRGSRCMSCKKSRENKGECEFNMKRFSPKIEIGEFVSMKELIKEQLTLISAN